MTAKVNRERPESWRAIAEATKNSDWNERLWVVGGAVRDRLLGLEASPDIDIVLEGDALALAQFLYKKHVSAIRPVVYPRFGAALVRVREGNIEIVGARRESYEQESRKPSVEPATLEEDARRRDFTINTLLENLHTGELRDPLGIGIADLDARTLRTPLRPEETFYDDPLRMLRAVRFANRFGLTPADGLWDAIKTERERLQIVSKERIRDEVVKMLLDDSAADSLRDLMNLGLLQTFAPEFAEGIGIDQGSYHTKDVWNHTLDVVEKASEFSKDLPLGQSEPEEAGPRLLVMLGALFHDVGKPRTRNVEQSGRVRFFGHEKIGAELAAKILHRMKFSRRTSLQVAAIVSNHMRLGSAVPFTLSAARRLVRDMEDLLEPLLLVCQADAAALRPIPKGVNFEDVREKIDQVARERPDTGFESPLSGEEIMRELGLEPGPDVGKWKDRLTEAVLEGVLAPDDRAGALRLLRSEAKPQNG